MPNEEFKTTFTLDDKVASPLNKLIKLLETFDKTLNKAQGGLSTLDNEDFNNLNKSLNSVSSGLEDINNSSKELKNSLGQANNSSLKSLSKDLDNITKSSNSTKTGLQKLGNTSFKGLRNEAEAASSEISEIGDEAEESQDALSKMENSFSGLKSTIAGAVAAFASFKTLQSAINLSDEMTQTTSRLNLMNDGLQSTEQLQEQIKQAALSSHAEYSTLADTVAKLGNNAGSAFSSSSEIVQFAEQLSKQFALSGASADEMAAATLQLTQGLGSGVLRGDEFNSVMEQAPGIAQMIADYLEVDKSQIRDLAGEGALTADVVKNAVLGATDETNRKFDQMRVTFSQLWTDFKTNAMFAFTPISEALSNIANNSNFQTAINNIGNIITNLGQSAGPIIESIGNAFVNGFSWLVQNWQVIASGIGAISGAVLSFIAAQKVSGIIETISAGFTNLMAGAGGNATLFTTIGKAILGLVNPTTLALTAIIGLAGATAVLMASGTKISDIIKAFSNFDTMVSGFAGNMEGMISGLVESIQNNLPQLAGKAGVIVSTLITGILNSAVNLVGTGAQLLLQLITGIAQAMPTVIKSGFTFLTNFLAGVMSGLPQIAGTVLTVIENFIGSLAENLPTLIQSGVDTIVAWLQGMQQMKNTLFQQALAMIAGFAETISEHLPELISKGFELITNLVTGILQALPSIAQAALSLIINFGAYILQNLPTIIQTGIQIVWSLVTGLIQSIPAILTGVAKLLGAIIDGIAQAIPNIVTAAWDMGKQLIQGLWNGVTASWSNFWTWVTDKFNGIIDWVKGIFGIASPSTVFADIGSNLLQGFWDGLKSIWDGLSGWIGGIWDKITNIFSGGDQQETVVDYSATIETTKSQIQELQNIVAQGFTNILSQIGSIMSQITSAMLSQFGNITGAILSQIQGLVAQSATGILGIVPYIQSLYTIFLAQTSQTLLALQAVTLSQVSVMVSQMGVMIGGLNGIFVAAFNIISSQTIAILASLNASSISILTSLSQSAADIMTVTKNNMINTVNSMAVSVIKAYSLIATQSISIIFNMANQLITDYTNLVNNITRLMTTLASSVLSIVTKFVQSIKSTVGTLPGYFYNIGVSMMNSLRSGIEASRGGVVATTSSLVQQLKSTFEGGLGIHSPSDYMIWIGQMMLAGLIEGMSSSQIQSFIESMIGDMQSSFENGKFNANELVNFLSDDATLNLIGKITGMDLGGMNPEQIAYPLIGTLGTQTSWFGPRESPGGIGSTNHGGVDLAAPTGTPIAAALGGNVTTAGWYGGYGQAVVIDSGNGIDITYGHMSAVGASVGQTVQKGQQIGLVGSTGNSTGPHLHFEMHQNGSRIDPQPYIEGASIAAGNTLSSAIQNAYNLKHGIVSAMSLGNINYDISAGASQWTPQVLQALAMLGQPASLLQGVLYAIDSESGGNPNAINDWDSNAAMGDPSRGLLQTIGGTFNAYRNPNLSANIYDPLANIYAGLNYMIQRYGSVANVVNPRLGHWYGYEVGTRYVPSDMLAMIHEGEAVIPAGQNPYSQSGGNYLSDIASRIVDSNNSFNAGDYLTPVSHGDNIVSVGDIQTTVNVSGNGVADPNQIAVAVSNQIMNDMRTAMSKKAGVKREY